MAKQAKKVTKKAKPGGGTGGGKQHDYILLDRSGSMIGRWDEALGGCNAYVEGLAKDKATKDISVTIAAFDGVSSGVDFTVMRDSVVASKFAKITSKEVEPRGMTPLNDAIGKIVERAKAANPDKCCIVIITDGAENASREINHAAAKALLDSCRAKGWQIIFMGCDFDNQQQAASYGNLAANTISVSAQNVNSTMRKTSRLRSVYSTTGAAMNYSAADKTDALKKGA